MAPSPLLYFWGDRAMYLGPGVAATLHQHHALQICIPLRGRLVLRPGPGWTWESYEGAIVPSNQPHESGEAVERLCSIWLEPDTAQGRRLAGLCTADRAAPIVRIEGMLRASVPRLLACWRDHPGAEVAAALVEEVVDALAPVQGPAPSDADARIGRALEIMLRAPGRRVSLSEIAGTQRLSPSRFAHLFRQTRATTLRRHLLWLRLRDAVQALAGGVTVTEAAHAVGFADAAHLSRTFRRMLGFSPSAALQPGPVRLRMVTAGSPPVVPGDTV